MRISKKLRRLRTQLGNPSKAEVARHVGTTGQTIGQIEAGNRAQPAIPTLIGLAKFYRVPLDWLLDDSEEWPPPPTQRAQAVDLVQSILAGEGLAGDLSEPERQLLAAYRSLAEADRRELLGFARGLALGSARAATPSGADTERFREVFEATLREEMDRIDRERSAETPPPRPGAQSA
jgi:transcriptional regulator with XRE-family HTH domain